MLTEYFMPPNNCFSFYMFVILSLQIYAILSYLSLKISEKFLLVFELAEQFISQLNSLFSTLPSLSLH